MIGQEALEASNIDRFIEFPTIALRLARMIADPPANARKRIFFEIDAEGSVPIAL
jgi:hypothetical protein